MQACVALDDAECMPGVIWHVYWLRCPVQHMHSLDHQMQPKLSVLVLGYNLHCV